MKKRYLIVILCIIAICILVVIFIVKNKKTINNYDNLVFEYNQKVKVSDIIPVRKDEYINTLKIGKNNLKYEIDKTIYNITYEVVDTSAPLVLLNSTYTYNIGDENDLKKRILCGDNYDKRPNCFIEGTYNFNDYKLSLTDLNMIADTFMNRLEEYGYKSMLYGSYYYLQNIWDVQNKNIWLAHYSNKTDYPNDYQIWQLSNIGKVNGINTDVDINVLYK